MKKSVLCLGLAAIFVTTSSLAMAGGILAPTVPIRVPEPGTFGLVAGAAVAVVVASWMIRRK